MVTSKEQALQEIKDLITRVSRLGHFDEKLKVMDALLDIEWSLREEELEEDEFRGGVEGPWSD